MNNKIFAIKIEEHESALNSYLNNHNNETEKYFESHKLEIIDDKIEYFEVKDKNIGGGVIVKTHLGEGSFLKCEAIGMYLFDNVFENMIFKKVNLRKSEFNGSHFASVLFKDCDISKSVFVGCKFLNVTFENCNVSWSNFINADLKEVTFNKVSFEGSVLVDSKISNKGKQNIDFGEKYPAQISNIDISIQGDKSKIVGFEGLKEYLNLS